MVVRCRRYCLCRRGRLMQWRWVVPAAVVARLDLVSRLALPAVAWLSLWVAEMVR